ncbi:DUF4147 domain-containing protein [Halorubrum sp. JWXQ-INN 858]|uniref:glycerate kinase type-2 family protein n=1 Tax=Halorubrum sp. JWXQ-INN 858 TaxID=2690782 RepID=UPI00135A0A08|nr:DUF4147 domain-containing protein [Halorubrum sp. JWXQ-INN 858]MWV65842.1 DUF4147 domain-containing protein [Halorubrum sp. JWXQ-INN 858]
MDERDEAAETPEAARAAEATAATEAAAHAVAVDCLSAGIAAARPDRAVAAALAVDDGDLVVTDVGGATARYDLDAYRDVVVVGGGNAAGGLAAVLESTLGDRIARGAVVTDDDATTGVVETLPGDHPLPSERGVAGARRVLEIATAADEDDLVIVAITGGASALLAAPAEPPSLADLRAVTEALLASGATIDEINAVRKHCSATKGGRLARAAAPATVVTLAVSDVVGDDPSVIGSGPTVPDPTTYADALDVVRRYGLAVPPAVRDHLRAGDAGERPETPTADDPAFDRTSVHVLASGRTALAAAADAAAERGYDPVVLAAGVRGEARESALTHVAVAEECRETGSPAAPPTVLLSGGETTVTLRDQGGTTEECESATAGRGGPNQEFALSAGLALSDDGIAVASVDTDGIDGPTDAAGAVVDAGTVPDREGRDALDRNDAYGVLDAADALIRTGPTGTNVNDLRVMVVTPGSE